MFNYLHEVRSLKANKDLRAIHDRAFEAVNDLKRSETNVILRLQEIDEFVVHRFLGYQDLYQYAIQGLRLSEWQASTYVALARKAKALPALQKAIELGEIAVSKAARITHVTNDRNQQHWVGLMLLDDQSSDPGACITPESHAADGTQPSIISPEVLVMAQPNPRGAKR